LKQAEWDAALHEGVRSSDTEALVETFVDGRELTVGVVGEQVLPVVEIRAPQRRLRLPRQVHRPASPSIWCPRRWRPTRPRGLPDARLAHVHRAGAARGLGRVDIRLAPDGQPYVLEFNTIPGFTETSLLPKAARCAGLEFPAAVRADSESCCAGRCGLIHAEGVFDRSFNIDVVP
jgi:D-alanine-D-alanine ligase